eukprot:gene30382-35390_t
MLVGVALCPSYPARYPGRYRPDRLNRQLITPRQLASTGPQATISGGFLPATQPISIRTAADSITPHIFQNSLQLRPPHQLRRMKNLVVQTDAAASLFEGGPAGERPSACCMCLNASEGKMYVATGTDVRCVPISKPNEVEWLERLAEYGSGRVVSMCFVVELEALCIGLSSGELLLLRCNNEGGVDEVEEVGGIEGGLCALEWSPDGEVFAAISGAGRLLVMNLEWELLFESSLPGVESADGDGCPPDLMTDAQISWRGDAKFFATSTRVVIGSQPASITPPRGIHVWDRSEGVVHSKAEGANLYSPVLAWQPNGRHLYTAAPTGAMRAEGPDVEAAAATAT